MIDTRLVRAAAEAADGELLALTKAQLFDLLDELERGQQAVRQVRMLDALHALMPEPRVSPGIAASDAG